MASGLGASCGTFYIVRGPSICRCGVKDMEERKAAGFVAVYDKVASILAEHGITNAAGGMRYHRGPYRDPAATVLTRYVRPKTVQWFIYDFVKTDAGDFTFNAEEDAERIITLEKNVAGAVYPVVSYYTEDALKKLVTDALKERDEVKKPFEPTGGTAAFPSAATVVLASRQLSPETAGALDAAMAANKEFTQIGALYSEGTDVSDVLVMILGGTIICGACGAKADPVVEKLMSTLLP